jgi:hypothetical protein
MLRMTVKDPPKWWWDHRRTYPALSRMAFNYLSIPCKSPFLHLEPVIRPVHPALHVSWVLVQQQSRQHQDSDEGHCQSEEARRMGAGRGYRGRRSCKLNNRCLF